MNGSGGALGRLWGRVSDGLGWRLADRWRAAAPVLLRYEGLGRRARWPVPGLAPYRRPVLEVSRQGALGDVLLCTPALRAAKRANPRGRIVLYTKFRSLVEGLPFIDEVRDWPAGGPPAGAVRLEYEHALPPRRHLARVIADGLGVRVADVRPACRVRPELRARFRAEYAKLGRPVVVLSRSASAWTPNKEWPAGHWEELIPLLLRAGVAVAEVGTAPPGGPASYPGAYLDLRGRTTLDELVAAVAAADVHVGPISGPVHLAAAFRVPAVVIYGGYEPPACTAYPGNRALLSPVPCAPCWLRDPCPIGRPCLTRVAPARAAVAVRRALDRAPTGGPPC